jgi:hypothetical protein
MIQKMMLPKHWKLQIIASCWIGLFQLNFLLKMMTLGEMDIARRGAVIVNVTEAVMEGDHPVLIVEKGVVLIMAMDPVHIRERGAALTMGVATAVVEAPPISGRGVALLMGVEALVLTEERGMVLSLFVAPAAVLITKSGGELAGLPLRVPKKERG